MLKRFQNSRLIIPVLTLAILFALGAFACVGMFSRYMADDYCLSAGLNKMGFLKAQTNMYMTWSGRYSYTFVISLLEWLGPLTVPAGPSAGLLLWLAGALWTFYQIALVAKWARPLLTSALMSALTIFAMLNGADNIVQSFYWQGGLVNYVVPLILMTIGVGVVGYSVRTPANRVAWLLSLMLLVFVAGGFTEAYTVLQTSVLCLTAAAFYKYASKSLRGRVLPLLGAATLSSLAALTVVFGAPGNAFRRGQFPPPPGLFRLVSLSAYYAGGFIIYEAIRSPLNVLLLVLVPAGLAYQHELGNAARLDNRILTGLLFQLPLAGFVLIFLCFMTGVYATSGALAERARFIPQFVFVTTAICWSYLAGRLLSKRLVSVDKPQRSWLMTPGFTVALLVVFLAPVLSTVRTLKLVPGARQGAAIWDQMDVEVRAAKSQGQMNLTVPALDDVETLLGARRTELHIEWDPDNWKNRCVARYYGVKSITAR